MGKSEWGVLVRSQADMRTVVQLVLQHNMLKEEDKGENLRMHSVIRYRGQLFLCLGNGGGADITTAFLNAHKPAHMTVLWPFDKPPGWNECTDYVWQAAHGVALKVFTRGLPDVSPPAPVPGLEPREPPARTIRDDVCDALMQAMQAYSTPAEVRIGYRRNS